VKEGEPYGASLGIYSGGEKRPPYSDLRKKGGNRSWRVNLFVFVWQDKGGRGRGTKKKNTSFICRFWKSQKGSVQIIQYPVIPYVMREKKKGEQTIPLKPFRKMGGEQKSGECDYVLFFVPTGSLL